MQYLGRSGVLELMATRPGPLSLLTEIEAHSHLYPPEVA